MQVNFRAVGIPFLDGWRLYEDESVADCGCCSSVGFAGFDGTGSGGFYGAVQGRHVYERGKERRRLPRTQGGANVACGNGSTGSCGDKGRASTARGSSGPDGSSGKGAGNVWWTEEPGGRGGIAATGSWRWTGDGVGEHVE